MCDIMGGIMCVVMQVVIVVVEIIVVLGEQQIGIQQVNEVVVLMDEVIQCNVVLVEEVVVVVGSLEELMQQMIQVISVFNLDGMVVMVVVLFMYDNKCVVLFCVV